MGKAELARSKHAPLGSNEPHETPADTITASVEPLEERELPAPDAPEGASACWSATEGVAFCCSLSQSDDSSSAESGVSESLSAAVASADGAASSAGSTMPARASRLATPSIATAAKSARPRSGRPEFRQEVVRQQIMTIANYCKRPRQPCQAPGGQNPEMPRRPLANASDDNGTD